MLKDTKFKYTIVVLLFFVINLIINLHFALSHENMFNDRLGYYSLAQSLYKNNGPSMEFKASVDLEDTAPPFYEKGRLLYPYLTSNVFTVFGSDEPKLANATTAVAKSLIVIPIFLIALALFGFATAVIALIFFSINSFFYFYGGIALTDMTFLLFAYGSIAAMLFYMRTANTKKQLLILITGALLAAGAQHAREEGMFLFLFWLISLIVNWLKHKKTKIVYYIVLIGVICISFYARYKIISTYTPSVPISKLLFSERKDLTSIVPEDFFRIHPLSFKEYFLTVGGIEGMVGVRVKNTAELWRRSVGYFSTRLTNAEAFTSLGGAILIIIGALFVLEKLIRSKMKDPSLWLVAVSFFYYALLLGFIGHNNVSVRNIAMFLPFAIMLQGYGVWSLLTRFKSLRAGRIVIYIVVALLITESTVFSISKNYTYFQVFQQPAASDGFIEASLWLKNKNIKNAVLVARKPERVWYFSGYTAIMLPLGNYKDSVNYFKKHRATHIIDNNSLAIVRPEFYQEAIKKGTIKAAVTTDSYTVYELRY